MQQPLPSLIARADSAVHNSKRLRRHVIIQSNTRSEVTAAADQSMSTCSYTEKRKNRCCRGQGLWHLHANFEKPYITVHKEILQMVRQMTKPGRACYLAALSVASLKLRTSFGITREQWKTETLLGKNGFNIGVKECKSKKLLTYKRGTLTLHDPVTGKPSGRVGGRVEHENPRWKFDLNAVNAETWRATVERLVKRSFIVAALGGRTRHAKPTVPSAKKYAASG